MSASPRRPVFADPKTGFVFKRIFGAEVHKRLLIELLNAFLELDDVVGVTICDFHLWAEPPQEGGKPVPMLSRWRMQELTGPGWLAPTTGTGANNRSEVAGAKADRHETVLRGVDRQRWTNTSNGLRVET